ncbi:hypothetical protein ACLQ2R_17130 [Streptosporangium sp. DT93]|uniref:hypothetical protein n=1 Tax=Streptosporangium sp. DT93 TaxID=3393428 RepID=UPI003CEECBB8
MPKKLTGPEHLDQAHELLADLAQARQDADWPRAAALAAAAQAHVEMAQLCCDLLRASAAGLSDRQGARWLDAAGVDRPR